MSDFSQLLSEDPGEEGLGDGAGDEEDDLMDVMMIPNLDSVQVVNPPTNVFIDQSPLQPQLQKNKESLEKKLLARRPMTTLVEQGIVPEFKTSPSLHFQRTKLERAKTGDILKSKISLRPERTELVHRHILEDVRPDVDPSLCDRQRQLKRAKLADSLANQLSHRPGPLELIQKNILHTDEPVEQAVKEGTLQFRPTTDGANRPGAPLAFDEDSSDTAPSPLVDTSVLSPAAPSTPFTRDTSSPNVTALLAQFSEISNSSRSIRSESLGDITSVQQRFDHDELIKSDIFGGSGGNLSVAGPITQGHDVFSAPNQHRDAPGKERKKLKPKSFSKPGTAPKPTTFKFHEYKGPPETLKRKKPEKRKDKSAHDLLLEQQQLLLQWQVENKNQYKLLLPAPIKTENGRASTMSVGTSSTSGYISGASSSCASPTSSVPGTPRSATPREATPTRMSSLTPQDVNNATSLLHKLDAMKVNDLKHELKKRNLPISGSKPALIEKLKPALEAVIAAGKKQFKQPYKQIQIASGGLIILKPSPNSQLLTNSEGKEKTPESVMSPAGLNHEGTPDMEDTCSSSSSSLTPLMLPLTGDMTSIGNLGLLGLLSPSESVHSLGTNSEIENILSDRRDSLHSLHSNTDLDLSLSFMDTVDNHVTPIMPPPAPPPPPPPQSKDPRPLPPPPTVLNVGQVQAHQQFLPPKQTSQQILLAKAALEAQLTSSDPKSSLMMTGSKSTRAGPKGQFIWPPVSVQSSQGTVITIRAVSGSETPPLTSETLITSATPPVRNETITSSRPVSQLAAVFSQATPSVPAPSATPSLLSSHAPSATPSLLSSHAPSATPSLLSSHAPSATPSLLSNHAPATTPSLPMFVRLPQEPVPPQQLGLAMDNTLPATLPVAVSDNNTNNSDTGDNMAEDIIKAQQQRIAELERALQERSRQQQLLASQQQQQLLSPAAGPAVNTKHLLAQQIHNKHQNLIISNKHSEANQHNNCDSAMEDVIDSLLKTEDLPESVQNFGVKVPEKPPSPPPLPTKSSPMFPTLDLADMSFDFGLGSEFEGMLDTSNGHLDTIQSQPTSGPNMDVDMDIDNVQDWLDSLVVPLNSKLHPDLSSQYKDKKNEMNSWAHGV